MAQTITYTPDPALSYWPTPPEVADDLVYEALCPGYAQGEGGNGVPRLRVLEPSAGEGHLARAIREYLPYAHLTVVEPAPSRAAALRATDLADDLVESTLEDYLTTEPAPFDLIFMNPPFTLANRPEAWADHVLAAYNHCLMPGGMLGAIVPPVVMTGSSRRVRAIREVLGTALGRYPSGTTVYRRGRVCPCEKGAFVKSVGAGIRPVKLWVEKPSGAE